MSSEISSSSSSAASEGTCFGKWAERFSDFEQIILPSGEVLEDTCIWPNFVGEELGIEISKVWDACLCRPSFPDSLDIPWDEDGMNPEWIRGSHPALRMRGNAIGRHKIWLQTEYDLGFKRYRYPGWQWKIAFAKHQLVSIPEVWELAGVLNEGFPEDKKLNDWIVTKYESKKDSIGYHQDKMVDWEEGTGFVVIKTGAARLFEIRVLDEGTLFSEKLPAGTAIFVGGDANQKVFHGVPRMKEGLD